MKGQISISKTNMNGIVSIRVTKEDTWQVFITIEMSILDFAQTLLGRSGCPCELEIMEKKND